MSSVVEFGPDMGGEVTIEEGFAEIERLRRIVTRYGELPRSEGSSTLDPNEADIMLQLLSRAEAVIYEFLEKRVS